MVSGASGAARSQEAQYWKGPNTIGTRERAWQKRQKTRRDIQRRCNTGRAGAHRPSEALHPTRSSDVLPRIVRERVPTAQCAVAPSRNVLACFGRAQRHQPASVLNFGIWANAIVQISVGHGDPPIVRSTRKTSVAPFAYDS